MLYSNLTLPEQSLYHVIFRVKNHNNDQFFHSIKTLQRLTGLSERAVQYALRGLEKKGIISRRERYARTSVYTMIDTAKLIQKNPDTPAYYAPHPAQHAPQSAYYAPITVNNPNRYNLTTTQEFPSKILYDKLITEYDKEKVDRNVAVILNLDGKIKNKNGLLVDSLRKGYTPASNRNEKAEIKAKAEKRVERGEFTNEKLLEYDKIRAEEEADTEKQRNIQREIDKIKALFHES